MRVVNSVLGDASGGRWQVVCDYSRVLRQRGHPVMMLLSQNHRPDLDKLPADVSVHFIRNRGHYDYPAAWSARRRMREFAPDLAIAHCSRSVALLKRALRGIAPVVAVSHSNKVRRLLPADAYLPSTSHIERSIKQAGEAASRKPCFIVPNMIAVDASRPLTVHRRRYPPSIGALGRFDRVKGFDVFIEALGLLRLRHVPFQAMLGGSGSEQGRLTEQARRLGLNGQLVFPGWVTQVDRFLAELDLLVVPARSDAFGLTPLQAAIAGVPLLLSRASGHREMFADGTEALFCDVDDPPAMAEQMLCLMTERELAVHLAEAAHQRVLRQYSADIVGATLLQAFETIIKTYHKYH